jgi:hypothetical protein
MFWEVRVLVSCGGVVEEGGVPPLADVHREADSRVEEVPDRCRTRSIDSFFLLAGIYESFSLQP